MGCQFSILYRGQGLRALAAHTYPKLVGVPTPSLPGSRIPISRTPQGKRKLVRENSGKLVREIKGGI